MQLKTREINKNKRGENNNIYVNETINKTSLFLGLLLLFIYFFNSTTFKLSYNFIPIVFVIILTSLYHAIKRKTFKLNPTTNCIIIYAIIISLSSILTYINQNPNIVVEWYPFATCFLMFILVISVINDKYNAKSIHFLITCFILSTTVLALFILLFREPFVNLKNGIYIIHKMRYVVKYLDNTYTDPNFLGMYLCSGTLFAFIRAFLYRQSKHKTLYSIVGIGNSIAIFLTGSRATFLALCIGLLCIIINYINNIPNKSIKLRLIIFICIFITISVFFFLYFIDDYYINRFLRFDDYNDGSNESRIETWIYGLRIISISPIFGHGCVASKNVIANMFYGRLGAHNSYIELGIQGGIIGLICIFSLLLTLLRNLLKKERKILLSIFISLIFMSIIIAAHNSFTLWIPIIILITCNNYLDENNSHALIDII